MAEPIKLQTAPQKGQLAAQESIVELLIEYLKRATDGEFSSLALCYVRPDGRFGSDTARSEDGAMLLGATVLLQHDIVDGIVDSPKEQSGGR